MPPEHELMGSVPSRFMPRRRTLDPTKVHGVQYTPPELAAFLAERVIAALQLKSGPISVLDPACGDGGLLLALRQACPPAQRKALTLLGCERDARALARARIRLRSPGGNVRLRHCDFLAAPDPAEAEEPVDVVIANPPYVRTQTLGAGLAQLLAARYQLTGRIDLYQAFAAAMADRLKPGGVLGLLISNRFLNVKSGEALRNLLLREFEIVGIDDLGDTKLFPAAVLPAIVIARKGRALSANAVRFDRVYATRDAPASAETSDEHACLLGAFRDPAVSGVVRSSGVAYSIERGTLRAGSGAWSLSTQASERWVNAVRSRQVHAFGEVARVRVGIKTTADEVFLRSDWESLPEDVRPEPELLRPLITHHHTERWRLSAGAPAVHVLYPHTMHAGRRRAVSLDRFPAAAGYLEAHRARLEARAYVRSAGREWYEIWVPHQPHDWARPKIVWPDIAESPRFGLDRSGAVVNGDCYWLTLRDGFHEDWLWLMLAVANSALATQFYDTLFHNKLYSGRRRFMTQYVSQFPLPRLDSEHGRELVALARQLAEGSLASSSVERPLDELVCAAFGVESDSHSSCSGDSIT
jgi:SAM-dependent methyltransferase